MRVSDDLTPQLIGSVEIFAGDSAEDAKPLCSFHNLVVNDSQTVIAGLLQRDFVNFAVQFIGVGDGGDFEQDAKVDSGARVAPAATDSEIRSVIARVPILQVDVDADNPLKWTYTAVAKKNEAVTTGFNELTLETTNGTLVSHFVTPAEVIDGRAQTYPKTALEFLILKWTLQLV